MKYIVVLGDGMADYPIDELDGKTPLEYADTPVMDDLAQRSEIGQVHTIPAGMSPGSDTANLSVLGYDPKKYYTGRSPLEALSIGVPMKDTDVAIRCNIVTVSDEKTEYKVDWEYCEAEESSELSECVDTSSLQYKNNLTIEVIGNKWKITNFDLPEEKLEVE